MAYARQNAGRILSQCDIRYGALCASIRFETKLFGGVYRSGEIKMFKRIMLALAFLAAFSTVSIGVPSSANAWRNWGWGGGYRGYYYGGPRGYYRPYVPYRAYYRPYYYAPRVYTAYPYEAYYGYPDYYYYGPRGGVSVSFGF
jgi:hypothetical protein